MLENSAKIPSHYKDEALLRNPAAIVNRYDFGSCPKCNGYLGIVVPEQKAKMHVQAINGRCLKCGYRLAWVLVRSKNVNATKLTTF